MDRITKSLLEEFASTQDLSSLEEEKQFENFAAYLAVSCHLGESFNTTEIITGAGGDLGIDAIATIVNGSLVTDPELVSELAETNGYIDATFIFVQAERSPGFDSAGIGQFGFGVVDFFNESPKLPRNAAVTDAGEVMTAVYRLSSKFKRGNPACRLYYVTTGKWLDDPHLEARKNTVIDDLSALHLFRDVEFVPVDADMIQRLYTQTRNAIVREITFPNRTVIPDIPGVTEAYLGIIPAKEFLRLVQDESDDIVRSLFYDNVRDWQDFNPVNSEIRDTLSASEGRARFVLMNNGVTVIARKLRATGNKFYVEDFQIVNGCQTSHVLWHQRGQLDDSVNVPLRLIATEDEAVIAAIIKATNRQTEVRQEQLLALSDFQKKLEVYFQSFEPPMCLFYERRSRQFNGIDNIEKTRIVVPGIVIRAFAAMFLEEPHRTTRNYRALLERVGTDILAPQHRLEPYYAAAFANYRLEYLFRNRQLDPKYKPARYHILLAVRLLGKPGALPPTNSREMERYCDALFEILWDTAAAEELFRKACKKVDRVAEGNFHRDHIRTQPFTEKLLEECR